MGQSYDFEVRITSKEYSALMDIRGLHQDAHMMVMKADLQANGDWILQGSHEIFDVLIQNLREDLDEGMAPKKNRPALMRIIKYITPLGDGYYSLDF